MKSIAIAEAAAYGQSRVDISIYPFRMTEQNLKRHASSAPYRLLAPAEAGLRLLREEPPAAGNGRGQMASTCWVNC